MAMRLGEGFGVEAGWGGAHISMAKALRKTVLSMTVFLRKRALYRC